MTVTSTGRDEVLGLAPNQWVELTDDARDKRGEPGLLVKLLQVEGNVVTIDPGGQTIAYSAFGPNTKLRRWDMPADTGEVIVTTNAATWTDLEQGFRSGSRTVRSVPATTGSFRPVPSPAISSGRALATNRRHSVRMASTTPIAN